LNLKSLLFPLGNELLLRLFCDFVGGFDYLFSGRGHSPVKGKRPFKGLDPFAVVLVLDLVAADAGLGPAFNAARARRLLLECDVGLRGQYPCVPQEVLVAGLLELEQVFLLVLHCACGRGTAGSPGSPPSRTGAGPGSAPLDWSPCHRMVYSRSIYMPRLSASYCVTLLVTFTSASRYFI
jgi:hypothetical protein